MATPSFTQIGNPPNSTATTRALRAAAVDRQRAGDAGAAAAEDLQVRCEAADVDAVEHRRADDAAVGVVARRVIRRQHGYNLISRSTRRSTSTPSISAPRSCRRIRIRRWRAPRPARRAFRPTCCARSGIRPINTQWRRFWNTFHSIQTSFNRRFRGGLRSASTTRSRWADRDERPATPDSAPPGAQRRRPASPTGRPGRAETLLKNNGLRRHVIKGNFVWDLPNLHARHGRLQGRWARSSTTGSSPGILTGRVGRPLHRSATVPERRHQLNLTGSPELPRANPIVGDPGSGCSRRSVLAVQRRGVCRSAAGQQRPRVGPQLMVGCPDKTLDCRFRATSGSAAPSRFSSASTCSTHSTPCLQRSPDAVAVEQPDRSDRAQPAVQRRRHAESDAPAAAKCRLWRGHRRAGDAQRTTAGAVPVLTG